MHEIRRGEGDGKGSGYELEACPESGRCGSIWLLMAGQEPGQMRRHRDGHGQAMMGFREWEGNEGGKGNGWCATSP